MFLDSAPDRWGRVLMSRREQLSSKQEGRKPKKLQESDYFLGVSDETRMGALRYRFDEDGPFITERTSLICPPIIKVRDLEYSSLQFEKQDSTEDEESRWLRQLLAPESSLGGARPKSNVRDTDGALWIAKFPSRKDFAI